MFLIYIHTHIYIYIIKTTQIKNNKIVRKELKTDLSTHHFDLMG